MTKEQFHLALEALGWSGHDLARQLKTSWSTVQRWTTGRYPVPPAVALWLQVIAAAHLSNPPPEDWF